MTCISINVAIATTNSLVMLIATTVGAGIMADVDNAVALSFTRSVGVALALVLLLQPFPLI